MTRIAFILYIAAMAYFLFFSEHYGRGSMDGDYRYNLQLFSEIRRYIVHRDVVGSEYFIVNIFGNIFAFAPFGFMIPSVNAKYNKFRDVLVLSFLLTLTIESLQLLLKVGIFDVDDLLMNTVGGLIGYVIFRICRKMLIK